MDISKYLPLCFRFLFGSINSKNKHLSPLLKNNSQIKFSIYPNSILLPKKIPKLIKLFSFHPIQKRSIIYFKKNNILNPIKYWLNRYKKLMMQLSMICLLSSNCYSKFKKKQRGTMPKPTWNYHQESLVRMRLNIIKNYLKFFSDLWKNV